MQPFGREAPPIRDFFGVLTGLAVSADGRELYASLNPKLIDFDNMRKPDAMNSRLLAFDLTQRRWLRSETGHLQKISALAIDPLRQRLFTGSWDNTVRSRETRGPDVKTFSGIGVSVVSLVDVSDAAVTAVDSLGRACAGRAPVASWSGSARVRPAISDYQAGQFRQQMWRRRYDRLVGTAPLPLDPGQRIEVESARLAALASAPLDLRKHLEWGGTHQQLATAKNATGTLTLFGDKNASRFVLRRFGDDGEQRWRENSAAGLVIAYP
jgi:WD40 repeat protein